MGFITVEIRRLVTTKCGLVIKSKWINTKESCLECVMDSIEYWNNDTTEEYRLKTSNTSIVLIPSCNVRHCEFQFREADSS